jgi:voltage-gated sodium channel
VNFAANCFWPFMTDAWNYLDFLVVTVSWISLALPGGGLGAISVIRLLRVFRVIRVIKRLKSLRRIVKALLSSVVPVSYSLVLLLLVTAIFAIVAVETMGSEHPELFGCFGTAYFTIWQV